MSGIVADAADPVSSVFQRFRAQRPLRAASVIVSVFGDTISVHGGSVWLGSLIRALEPLGITERLVRTSVFRLVQDNWLSVERIGRRSFYRFTDHGRAEYARAAERIYRASRPLWDGQWTLVMEATVPEDVREPLRRSLSWLGFGNLASGVYARPSGERRPVEDLLDELAVRDAVVLMEAETAAVNGELGLGELVRRCWPLEELEERYGRFLARFDAVLGATDRQTRLDPEQAFGLRTLLIHEYRRMILHDPDLPASLLPANWPGEAARGLTRSLYRRLSPPCEQYVMTRLERAEGPLPAPDAAFRRRFA